MSNDRFDVVGIGNAMVDIVASCDRDFLVRHGLRLESVRQIDAALSATIQRELPNSRRLAAGSCVNTLVGVRSLGGRTAFIGRVGNDEMGQFFDRDLNSTDVVFSNIARIVEGATSHNIILVTPDGRRTIATCLGCSTRLKSGDLDPELIKSGRIIYLEGYLLDSDVTRKALSQALEIAKSADRLVAIGLSHRSVVGRHRAEILELVRGGVDVLFGNESEITSLYQTTNFGEAAHLAAQDVAVVALTRGRKGSYVLTKERAVHAKGPACDRIVDITGAGDLFAAGFLMAMSEHNSIDLAARLGNAVAAAITQQFGARPEKSLADLARLKGLIAETRPVYSEHELFS
jgi:sugar/nucleoside kinase (ribokinase family)